VRHRHLKLGDLVERNNNPYRPEEYRDQCCKIALVVDVNWENHWNDDGHIFTLLCSHGNKGAYQMNWRVISESNYR
jgi:hypothetical protein